MPDNHRYNHFVIIALILIVGLGLALALPWLAKAHSLAADEPPTETPDFAEVVRAAEIAYALAVEKENNVPVPPDMCFATHNDGIDEFSSFNASAIQQAVDAASVGNTVKAAGTCIGVESRAGLTQTVYISKSLTLEGGHTKSDWTLEPDPDNYTTTLNANNSGRVIVISGTNDVTLNSIFLTGGLADDSTLDNNGGGIWSNSEMTLTNSIIYSNTAAGFGGGMLNRNVSPVLTNVTFSGNSVGHTGGAMFNWGPYGTSSPRLTNVVFSGNSAIRNGGAIYNYGYLGTSSPSLSNVTFSGNSAGESGGAMYNYGEHGTSIVQVYNSILWNNNDSSGTGTISATIYNNSALIILTQSLVEGSGGSGSGWIGGSYWDGEGNIDEDPLFITPISPTTAPTTTGNLRLENGSPAIDAGDNDYVDVPTDLDGEVRIKDGNGDGTETVDMGAYEFGDETYIPLIFR